MNYRMVEERRNIRPKKLECLESLPKISLGASYSLQLMSWQTSGKSIPKMQKLQVETYHLEKQQHKSIEKKRHFSGNFSLILFLKNLQGSCRFFKPFLQTVPPQGFSKTHPFRKLPIDEDPIHFLSRLVKKFLLNDDLQLLCHQDAGQPRVTVTRTAGCTQKEKCLRLAKQKDETTCGSLDLQWCF